MFNLVQKELPERKHTVYKGIFSGRIMCGVCGGVYGHKIWHCNTKYQKELWQCNEKYAIKGKPCSSPNITEEKLKELYIKAVNQLIPKREELISNFEILKDEIFTTSKHEMQREKLQVEQAEIIHLMDQLTAQNASVEMDQKTYKKRFEHLSKRYEGVNAKLEAIEESIRDIHYRRTKTDMFLKALSKHQSLVTEFSHELWHALADHVTMYSKEDIRFTFKNGLEIKA